MSEVMDKPAAKKALKKFKITFHGEGGDVELGHNYRMNLYKRNVETVIDENYLAVLKDAVVHTEVQDAEGNKKQVRIPQYSYTLDGEV